MRPFTRIAAIVLGAFALGVFVVLGWTTVVAEVVDLRDRLRRARCTWVDPLPVAVAGHEIALVARVETTVYTGTDWIGVEEVSGYRADERRHGFCLDAPARTVLPVRAISFGPAPSRFLADRAGLPDLAGRSLEIADPAMFLPDAPPPVGQGTDLVVYGRHPDHGWPRMVTAGIGPDGFRIGAVCRGAVPAGWLCDVAVLDTRAGLSYRVAQLPVASHSFDGRPLPEAFRSAAGAMRALVDDLAADTQALAQR